MRARFVRVAIGIGFFAVTGGCSLFVDLDGLADGDAGSASSSDASIDQQTTSSDAAADVASDDASSGIAAKYAAAILADSPLAYFHLDEASGQAIADSSGNGHDAQKNDGVALGGVGAFAGSSSVHFNGDDGYIAITDSVGANDAGTAFDFVNEAPFTLEAWIKVDAPATNAANFTFFSKEQALGSGHFHGVDFFSQPSLTLQREDDPIDETELDTPAGLPDTTAWHYVVGVFDGMKITIYVDLLLLGTNDSASTDLPSTPVPFLLGAEDTTGGSGLLGSMDEAAIYTKALTTAQMSTHFHASGR